MWPCLCKNLIQLSLGLLARDRRALIPLTGFNSPRFALGTLFHIAGHVYHRYSPRAPQGKPRKSIHVLKRSSDRSVHAITPLFINTDVLGDLGRLRNDKSPVFHNHVCSRCLLSRSAQVVGASWLCLSHSFLFPSNCSDLELLMVMTVLAVH